VTLARFTAPDPQLDHLVYAVLDLDVAAAAFTTATNASPMINPDGAMWVAATRSAFVIVMITTRWEGDGRRDHN